MSPSALPVAGPAPADGALPAEVVEGAARRALRLYVHVPFCAVRCGYCDFNTYTATELGGGADQADYAATATREIALAAQVLDAAGLPARPLSSVFFGGGTPTLLPADDLVALLHTARAHWGLAADAEVTVEANPESVHAHTLRRLADGGVTRVSFGMQSAVPHVLAALDRTHRPERVGQAVGWARAAGLQVSLDLIYGAPGESLADWRTSLEAAVALAPDHVSAYALVVEDGTKLAARVRRGELPAPDDDDLADKYDLADDVLAGHGLGWYEVSNWARDEAAACGHNLGYWRGDDWWGVGPGAHSHVGGVRWWNVRHPRDYAARLAEGLSPAAGREVLDAAERHAEEVLLGVRLRDGLALGGPGRRRFDAGAVAGLVADGLVEATTAVRRDDPRLVLTRRGRLLADLVVRRLLG